MVFGIGQEIRNSKEDEFDYVMFQKYYQRIVKKTGNKYKKWLNTTNNVNVYIYGHSLDEPDNDIIEGFVNHKNSKIYIFYYDQKSFNSMVINLIKTFQKDRVISLTNSGKLEFVHCDDKEKIKEIIKSQNKSSAI